MNVSGREYLAILDPCGEKFPNRSRRDVVPDRLGARRRHRHHGEGSAGGEELLPGLPGGLHLHPDCGERSAGESGLKPTGTQNRSAAKIIQIRANLFTLQPERSERCLSRFSVVK